jgi:putative polyhydroxyalkanoate system protein
MRIERDHSLGTEEAKRRVDKIRQDVEAQYGLTTVWEGDDLRVSGSGVKGQIRVDERQIVVDINLGFAMMMLEGPIKSSISSTLDKHLT